MEQEKKPKNPPAFPIPSLKQEGNQAIGADFDYRENGQEGMTLRDYFAAKVLNGFAKSITSDLSAAQAILKESKERNMTVPETIAISSYELADVMLKQREL